MTKDLGVEVLITEATASQLGDQIKLTELGEFPVRGCVGPVRLWTLENEGESGALGSEAGGGSTR